MRLAFDAADPLTLAMAPPENETLEERLAREEKEARAIEVSKRIDAELKAAKIAMKKKDKAIKVLVLGQSLSGKSTTIKNFQMTYAQKSWAEERASWKAVVLLNLVRSVNSIVDIITQEINMTNGIYPDDGETIRGGPSTPPVQLTEQHKSLTFRLAPLRQIEKDLKSLLGSGSSETGERVDSLPDVPEARSTLHEFALRSTSGWKSVLDHIRNPAEGKEKQMHRVAHHVVSSCKEDIKWLWNDSAIQRILYNRQIGLEDAPGFFLKDIDRIAKLDYEPSDEDVVRARLRTTGVQEYHFTLDRGGANESFPMCSESYDQDVPAPILGSAASLEWLMYDVAGIRTARAAWIPYFDKITTIIFLAPLSSFNERLTEDPRINRLDDTFALWKSICASKLLANVQIILFMNKTDILMRKLDAGILVRDHIPEYKDRPNDFATVTTWFRRTFARMYKEVTPPGRSLNAHFTSVVDTKSTSQTLAAVQGVILRNDIADAGLM